MSLAVVFDVPGMTMEQYDAVIEALEASGSATPDGRVAHVAAPTPSGWWVMDVWESADQLDRFVPTLMPILAQAGVSPPTPVVMPVHSLILP